MEIEKRAASVMRKHRQWNSLHDHRAPCNWWRASSPKNAMLPTTATKSETQLKAKLAQRGRWHVPR